MHAARRGGRSARFCVADDVVICCEGGDPQRIGSTDVTIQVVRKSLRCSRNSIEYYSDLVILIYNKTSDLFGNLFEFTNILIFSHKLFFEVGNRASNISNNVFDLRI